MDAMIAVRSPHAPVRFHQPVRRNALQELTAVVGLGTHQLTLKPLLLLSIVLA